MPPCQDEVQLCALLVDETYGELAARIITILLRRGRLPLQTLRAHTRLNPYHLRLGLAVLIQQNLVYFTVDADFNTTYYEARIEAAYALVRSGKFLQLIEARYGKIAMSLVQTLLALGHTRISNVLESAGESIAAHSNGHVEDNKASSHKTSILPEVSGALFDLLEAGYIQQVKDAMFQSPADTEAQTEKELLRSFYKGSTRGNKQKDELRDMVRQRLRSIRDDALVGQGFRGKRKASSERDDRINGNSKRRRTLNGSVIGGMSLVEKSTKLDQAMVIRINYEKCVVALRTQCLVAFARDRIGETTSRVYGEVLKLLEESIVRCRADLNIDDLDEIADSPSISTLEIDAAMSQHVNVATGIGKAKNGQIDISKVDRTWKTRGRMGDDHEAHTHANLERSEMDEENDHLNGGSDGLGLVHGHGHGSLNLASARNEAERAVTFQEQLPRSDPSIDHDNRLKQLKDHLLLLSGDPCLLLRKCGSRGLGEWTVDFKPLMAKIRESELDKTIFDTFGNSGLRLVRLLKNFGKLEEKQLPSLALMKSKDIRTKMVELHHAGMIDIQEIPKDTAHAVSRTIFLWHFDDERVSQILLMRTYKAMLRCFQRLDVEKRAATEVLNLADRTDVKSLGEEAVMSASHIRQLRSIRGIEEKLLVQVGRLDDLVGVFRDY